MNREVRFWESPEVRVLRATRHFEGKGVALLCTSDCPAHGTAACGAFFSSNRLLSQVGGKHQSSRFESGKRWVSL